MNKFNFQAMTKHGFLIIPKTLLQQQIENPHLQEGEIEALLKILMKVNYSETLYNDRCNKNCPCCRLPVVVPCHSVSSTRVAPWRCSPWEAA